MAGSVARVAPAPALVSWRRQSWSRAPESALQRLIAADIPLDGASDHGVSEALYLRDPDQNGVELYWDRPKDQWPRTPAGDLAMVTQRLDLRDLLKAAKPTA